MLFPHLIKKEKYFRGQRFVDRWCQRFSCCFIVFGVAVIDSVIIVVFPVFPTKINTFPQALLGFVDLQGMLDKRVRIGNFFSLTKNRILLRLLYKEYDLLVQS